MLRELRLIAIAPLCLIKTALVVLVSAVVLASGPLMQSGRYTLAVNDGEATVVEVDAEQMHPESDAEKTVPALPKPQAVQAAVAFDEQLGKLPGYSQALAYAAAGAPVAKEKQPALPLATKIRLASRSGEIPVPRQAQAAVHIVKELPKPKPAAVAPAKVKLSSDNWPLLKPYQKWKFVEAFIKSKHWVCPPSGHDPQWEMNELQKHDWSTILNFGFNNCVVRG